MKIRNPFCRLWFLPFFLIACTPAVQTKYLSTQSASQHILSKETLLLNSSTPQLALREAVVLTDNDEAFESKLELINRAQKSIDLVYYIYQDDYSSSVLTQALIEAARSGIHVRILLDYFTNYKRLDYFSMMEHYGNQGIGSLQVRLYNRPTKNIIKDAVYLTLSCKKVMSTPELSGCREAKFKEIERIFEQEKTNPALPYDYQNISNFNSGGSGMFLSGLYGKNLEVALIAILEGQEIDLSQGKKTEPEPKEEKRIEGIHMDLAIRAGKVFWEARSNNPEQFQQKVAQLKLDMAFALFGGKLNPIYDALRAYLPFGERPDREKFFRDWDYFTEFTHHKLLLIDGKEFQLGGRNIEDSYHMSPSPLVQKYLFMDTDVRVKLRKEEPSMRRAFESIWQFTPMVASLHDIRQHAPNEFLFAHKEAKKTCEGLHPEKDDPEYQSCYQRTFGEAKDLDERMEQLYQDMLARVETFHQEYGPSNDSQRSPSFLLDPTAEAYYIENLPFGRPEAGKRPVRSYGAHNGLEGESGKYIHNLWLAALRNVCTIASAENPQEIIFHNAYLFMPSNMLKLIGNMVDGDMDCRHVHVRVITNSPETTDLNVINLAARYSTKALLNYYQSYRAPERAATFSYFEYKSPEKGSGRADRSLHSKVMVLGPDMFIGSANTDVRSYMMDSNNGVYIQNAPELVSSYKSWVTDLTHDADQITNKTGYLAKTTVDQMLAADTAMITALLKRIAGGGKLEKKVSLEDLAERLARILKAIYTLTTNLLEESKPDEEAQREFNALFKVL